MITPSENASKVVYYNYKKKVVDVNLGDTTYGIGMRFQIFSHTMQAVAKSNM